jgi:hypothetical protein
MGSAAEILVIILSSFLAFFLVLGIVLAFYLIALTRQIRRVAKSAERTADDFESLVSKATNVTSSIFVAETIAKLIKKIKAKKRG